jgi:hypothetical protein
MAQLVLLVLVHAVPFVHHAVPCMIFKVLAISETYLH